MIPLGCINKWNKLDYFAHNFNKHLWLASRYSRYNLTLWPFDSRELVCLACRFQFSDEWRENIDTQEFDSVVIPINPNGAPISWENRLTLAYARCFQPMAKYHFTNLSHFMTFSKKKAAHRRILEKSFSVSLVPKGH